MVSLLEDPMIYPLFLLSPPQKPSFECVRPLHVRFLCTLKNSVHNSPTLQIQRRYGWYIRKRIVYSSVLNNPIVHTHTQGRGIWFKVVEKGRGMM